MLTSFVEPRSLRLIAAGAVLGVMITLGVNHLTESQQPANAAAAQKTSPKVLYWYDPMVPAQRFDKPGKSPFMDMQLVPKYADMAESTGVLHIDPAQVQNLGIRRATVTRIPIGTQIEASGTLRFNERNLAIVQLRANGFVEKVWSLAIGDRVTAGQPIVELLIPDWLTPQIELLALKATNNPNLMKTARSRLRLLGMPDALIAQVESSHQPQTRIVISAPLTGVIVALDVKTGMALMSGQTLVRINGLDTLWLDAAIPEAQANSVQPGDVATFYPANAIPVTGKVDYLLPMLNETTRTFTARVVLPNTADALLSGISGRVTLRSAQAGSELAVPTEAVIRTGKRAVVMVAEADGRFRPVMVSTGAEIAENIIITAGLDEGQEIVASGQFLLDSESSMLGITPAPLPHTTPPQEPSSSASKSPISIVGLHQATGRIVTLSAKEVSLNHSDFIELATQKVSMRAMTMAFPLVNEAVAQGFKIGDSVRVSARKTGGSFVIEKMDMDTSPAGEKQP
jgi:membrane fusion protein, copper/silver efflux system